MLLHLPFLLLCCGSPDGPLPTTATRPDADARGAALVSDPGLYAAKAAPTGSEPWSGPWAARVYAERVDTPGALALARGLGLALEPWDGTLPTVGRGELAVIWLGPSDTASAQLIRRSDGNQQQAGAVVGVLGPGDPSWAQDLAQRLPWLGVGVLDAAQSTGLWADPALATQTPELAGLVMARELAEHFSLAYLPPPTAPTAVPGVAQYLAPQPAAALEDPRARATAVRWDPDVHLVSDSEVAVRLALAGSSEDPATLAILAHDPDPLVRARAADGLAVVDLLQELGGDSSSVVQVFATHSLARLAQGGQDTPALREALCVFALTSPNAYQRWKAAFGLGWLPGQVEVLTQLLADPDVDVRREAATALGRQRDPRALEPLVAALGDPNSFLRTTAAQALGSLGDPRAIPALRAALRDPVLLVAGEAAGALRLLGEAAEAPRYVPPTPPADPSALPMLLQSSDATMRKDASKFTAGRQDALALLEPLTTDPDPEVRKAAASALGWAPGAVTLLLPMLTDSDLDVQVTTLDSLRRVGGFEAEALAPFVQHPDAELRLRAAEALASLGPHTLLESFANEPDERIRAAAARVYPERVPTDEPSVLVRRVAAALVPERWRDDPSALVRFAASDDPAPHGAYWARGVLAREDDLLHLRFSFNDEESMPRSHQSLRPPVVREYGHPDRG